MESAHHIVWFVGMSGDWITVITVVMLLYFSFLLSIAFYLLFRHLYFVSKVIICGCIEIHKTHLL